MTQPPRPSLGSEAVLVWCGGTESCIASQMKDSVVILLETGGVQGHHVPDSPPFSSKPHPWSLYPLNKSLV